ncbi:gliding motility-associated-like protein [Chitinophaga niastensis]|uniref:Gliding motility-associated-like protein n=1 Tax=Chitinophaga niastensis TaxID=536980 RepID=A0A2P8HVL2_CHINA|nr:PKD domain-containing protein [Chitinophaga niastensis]PSL50204.1 gliding motility-associated-like protein [Chitinophaga niastensis]
MKYLQAKCFRALLLLIFLLQANWLLAQQANFTYTAAPATLCTPVTLTFKNTSTGTPTGYSWDFGDGRTSHDPSPQITYTTGGPVKITLTVQYSNSSSTYWRDIVIGTTPQIAFSADVTKSCKIYTANFTDATPNAASRVWDFGDGTPPVTTSNAFYPHNYTTAGKYDVTLSVTNINGCTAILKKPAYIDVSLPEITLSSPVSGCVPYTATFSATSTNGVNDPVTSWIWTFGDGNTQTTNNGNATHAYTQTGTYNVGVTVNTQNRCTTTKSFDKYVHTGNPPTNVSFSVSPTSTCVGDPVRLLANANFADTYSWNFGDSQTAEGPANDIKHTFTANGNLTVQMKAGLNGCFTTATPATVAVTGPVSQFAVVRDCSNKSKFIFTNNSIGINVNSTFIWDFGDNSPTVNTQDAVHTYTTPGNYTVRLTIGETGNNCNSSSFQTVYNFKADFTTGVSSICRGGKATYEVLNVPLGLVSSYTWQLGDGTVYTTTDQTYVKTWAIAGTFNDQLTVHYKNPAYCDDIVYKSADINILAPQANFTTGPSTCAGQPVTFINTTVTSPNIPVTNWSWDLGNGQLSISQTPPATRYSTSGGQLVKLVITDARNCQDSISKNININPTPYVRAAALQPKICEGNSVGLNASSDGNIQWLSANNISCIFCPAPIVSPVSNARYLVQASNSYGCTVFDSVDIAVVPKVNLTVSNDTIVCYGSSVKMQASGAAIYDWTPVTGLTNNTIASPVSTPIADITYQVTGTNDALCPMSAPLSIKIAVKPVPDVSAGKDQTVMVGDIVKLMASGSPDIVKWSWSPTDYLDNPSSPFVTAAVRKPMTYSVTATNQYGCTKSDVMNIDLICNTDVMFIPNTFSPNGDGQNDIFYPRGKGISFIKSFRIFNRLGQEVFHREHINIEDISAGWNGTFNGKPQPSDVYIYFIEAYCDTNEFFRMKGNVTLLR